MAHTVQGKVEFSNLGGFHSSWKCGSGPAIWLQTAKRLHLRMEVLFVSLVMAVARFLPESQPLALVCANLKELETLAGFVFGCCTCLVLRSTLNILLKLRRKGKATDHHG